MKKLGVIAAAFGCLVSLGVRSNTYRTVGNPRAPQAGKLTELLYAEPSSLNPIDIQDHASQVILGKIFDSLQMQNPRTGAWEPAIASNTVRSETDSTVTYQIRSGVIFHDGRPLLASDVAFTIRTFQEKASIVGPLLRDIVAIEDVPPSSIRIRMRTFRPEVVDLVSTLPILPKHLYEKGTPPRPIGSGPYLVEDYAVGDRIQLKRFPNWYGDKLSHFRGMANFSEWRLKFMDRNEADSNPFETQTADLIRFSTLAGLRVLSNYTVPSETWEVLSPSTSPEKSRYQIVWNTQAPTLSDVRVREALTLGTPVERSVSELYSTHATALSRTYDLIRARSLIHATGILRKTGQDETPLIEILVTNEAEEALISRMYRASVRELGIAIRALVVSPQDLTRRLASGNYAGALVGLRVEPENPISQGPLTPSAQYAVLPLLEAPSEQVALRRSIRRMDPPFEAALGELYYWVDSET